MTYQEKINRIEQLSKGLGATVLRDEPLERHTSVKVGGKCDLAVFAPDSETAAKIYHECKAISLYAMVMGNGSNCLFADEGFRGAVILPAAHSGRIEVDGERITASAGIQLSEVCKTALQNGLTGLEFAYDGG